MASKPADKLRPLPTREVVRTGGVQRAVLVAFGLCIALAWSYWPTLRDLFAFWQENSDYSSGQFVPLLVLYVVWSRRAALKQLPLRTCWAALGLLAAAQAVRFYGIYDFYGSLERYSLILTVIALVWLLLGTRFVLQFGWPLLFLFLTVPLPNRIHNSLSLPLQDFATRSAVFGLETIGHLVVREGNVLRMSENNVVAVAEACSGLRMLNAFVVVCVALAFVVRRPLWQKSIVVLSSIPVAVASNTIRLVATVLLFEYVGGEFAQKFFHDFAGITMMPLAIVIAVAELKLLGWLTGNPDASGSPSRNPDQRPRLKPKLVHAHEL